jgi:hypothetical protein
MRTGRVRNCDAFFTKRFSPAGGAMNFYDDLQRIVSRHDVLAEFPHHDVVFEDAQLSLLNRLSPGKAIQ